MRATVTTAGSGAGTVTTGDGVVVFRRRGITIAEAYFDPAAAARPAPEHADLLRVVCAFAPPQESGWRQRHTLVLDLRDDEDRLLAGMSKDTRYKIRRAERDAVTVAAMPEPSDADIAAFADFYDRFARAQAVSPAFRPRLHALARRGNLVLTTAARESGGLLVGHAYVAARSRAYMLYSGSVLAEANDSGERNLIGRVNRCLHWHDLRLFKARGFELYDFGGLDVEERSPKTAAIARFKRGFGGEARPVYSTTRARSLRGAAVRRLLALRGIDF